MEKSLYEKTYDYLSSHPQANNDEIAESINTSTHNIKVYIHRLRKNNLIDVETVDGVRNVIILREFKFDEFHRPKTYKQEVYQQMVTEYLEDFKMSQTFRERVDVGREIRLLLKDM